MNVENLEFEKYKVFVYVPEESLQAVLDGLRAADINKLGNYKNCFSWKKQTSTWTPIDEATPYNGERGEISYCDEYKIEFLCAKADLKRAVQVICDNHPYEEVEIDIFPIIYGTDLLK